MSANSTGRNTNRVMRGTRQRAEFLAVLWRTCPRYLGRRNKSGVYHNGGIAPAPRQKTRRSRVRRLVDKRKGLHRRDGVREISRMTAAATPIAPIGLTARPGSARCARSPVAWCAMPGYDGASRRSSSPIAKMAEAASLPTRDAGIARNDLPKPLHSDPRCSEKGADGALTDGAADAPGLGTTKNGLGQIVDAVSIRERPAEVEDEPCRAAGKETFSREQTTRTSRRWSATYALCDAAQGCVDRLRPPPKADIQLQESAEVAERRRANHSILPA